MAASDGDSHCSYFDRKISYSLITLRIVIVSPFLIIK